MELNEIRQEIDAINRQMQSLFERRMELCGKVAEYKGAHSMKIFVPEREEAILSTVREQASPAFAEYDVEFFRCLLTLSRTYQGALLGLDPKKTAVAERYETEHLLLRPLKREDLPPVFSLTSDPEVTRYLRFDTHTDPMEALVLIDGAMPESFSPSPKKRRRSFLSRLSGHGSPMETPAPAALWKRPASPWSSA